MSTYNVHAGHGLPNGQGCGAVGCLDESVEDRLVKNKLIAYLKQAGHTVYDCTQDVHASASNILVSIVKACNTHSVDLDISIHLNSGRADYIGDGKTGGVEVYGFDNTTKKIGAAICTKIAGALKITNRGFKINQGLYVLKYTKSPAILIECCFVDDVDDEKAWDADKCAKAIAEALLGTSISESGSTTTTNTTTTTTSTTPTLKYSVGTYVTVSSYYTSSTDGIAKAKFGTKSGTIIKTYPGKNNPYAVGTGSTVSFFCNDGDIRSTGKESTKVKTVASTPKILYQVYANNKWLPVVTGSTDYAGIENKPITAFAAHLSDGSPLLYRVHLVGGGWLSWISKHDTNDYYHGFAGNQKTAIDAIQIKSDKCTVEYKVSVTGTAAYYPSVKNASDYAGVLGKSIDKVMAWT